MLDSSALLALLFSEDGGDRVSGRLASAAISTVNWSEVAQRILEETRGAAAVEAARAQLEAVGLVIEPYLREDAHEAALIRPWTKDLGLSLGDRSCLALARRFGVPALTADRAWADLPVDLHLEVEQIR